MADVEEKKIYVGNLDYAVTDQELQSAFEDKGISTKKAKIIKDKFTGRSKGFGFVELNTEEDVQKAIDSLDGQEVKGRKIRVSKAHKPRTKFDRNSSFRFKR